jgi:hypothetical protein
MALNGKPRGSYVMWQETVIPPVLIELVSGDKDGSEERDDTPDTGKFWVYEQGIQSPYYLIFDWKEGGSIDAYQRIDGRYQPLLPNPRGHFVIPPLQCEFGIRRAVYWGYDVAWLRAFDLEGRLLQYGAERAKQEKERAEQETQRAEQEKQRAEQEKQRADKLAARLRELGIDPTNP